MNGKVISMASAYGTMTKQMNMTPSQYINDLQKILPTVDNAAALAGKGMLPPYHPHCHGIVIKRVRS